MSSKKVFSKMGCSDAFHSGGGRLPAHRRCAGRQAGFGDGLFGLAFGFVQNY